METKEWSSLDDGKKGEKGFLSEAVRRAKKEKKRKRKTERERGTEKIKGFDIGSRGKIVEEKKKK